MKKTTFIKQLSLLISLFCAVNFGFGQSIFSNVITGTNPGQTVGAYTTNQIIDDNITVSGISKGGGILGTIANERYNASSWSTDTTLDLTNYFEFTLTPNSGYEINFVSFVYTGQVSVTGPTSFAFRSSLDTYSTNIGTPTATGVTINLSSATYQNISTPVTFRIYAWNAIAGTGTFSINDFTFNGTVSAIPCFATTTWNSTSWSDGLPDINTNAIIAANYNTSFGGDQTSFSACSLAVENGAVLDVADHTFIEVQNNIIVDAGSTFLVQSSGAVVQIDDAGTVINNGTMTIVKRTSWLGAWYEYTYWSSPVFEPAIKDALSESDASRRYKFNASLFADLYEESNNDNNKTVLGQDDIDDNDDDWQWIDGNTKMKPGVGYAATHSEAFFFGPPFATPPYQFNYTFDGRFNNGVIPVPVERNDDTDQDFNWNLLGNPYPSAIDVDAFFNENVYDATSNPTGIIEGVIYIWSQNTPPSSTENGNQVLNFSATDYATINKIGEAKGGDADTNGDGVVDSEDEIKRFIPSGQAFFATFSNDPINSTGTVVFNNSMRVIGATDNSQFFKNTKSKAKPSISSNKLWVNLTSDNGIFNQILVGYVNGATNDDDGLSYDATKNLASGTAAILYSTIEGSNKKFAIQGKDANSLDENEIIKLGFKSTINVATLFTLSVAQLEGDFLNSNTIYLKDNLLNKTHDLSASDYTFTSAVGEFNNRFEVAFSTQALAVDDVLLNKNALKIVQLDNDDVQFNTTNSLSIKTVRIYDMLGRQLYSFKGETASETYKLSNLNNSIFIAKVELSNGTVISKKAFKK